MKEREQKLPGLLRRAFYAQRQGRPQVLWDKLLSAQTAQCGEHLARPPYFFPFRLSVWGLPVEGTLSSRWGWEGPGSLESLGKSQGGFLSSPLAPTGELGMFVFVLEQKTHLFLLLPVKTLFRETQQAYRPRE